MVKEQQEVATTAEQLGDTASTGAITEGSQTGAAGLDKGRQVLPHKEETSGMYISVSPSSNSLVS